MNSPCKNVSVRKYRPGNAQEGLEFTRIWCDQCERDRAFREEISECEGCKIMDAAHIFNIEDPGYPIEWVKDINGLPCCTAYIPEGESVHYKDDVTTDMFGKVKNEQL
mgnify:CR=1 FL=1